MASLPIFDARSSQSPFGRDRMVLLEQHVEFGRRKVPTNDPIYQCGQKFDTIYVMASGLCKIVNLSPDGREQAVGLHFKYDWLGFDGIPTGRYACSAIALENSEVWTVRYNHLLQASASHPLLMRAMLAAMSTQLVCNRDALLSMGTLGTDARVAEFLLQWANALAERGQCTEQIRVRMSRVDIGSYLGMRVESVSRALTKMARYGVIEFKEHGRRDISIPSLAALHVFIQNSTEVPL
ncbi:MAG: Crp/Fnr family transcriptional regulator [Rhodoferax sp.]